MITERPGIGPTALAVAAGAGFGGLTLATAASSSVSATVVVVVGIVWILLPLAVARGGHGSTDRSRPSLDRPRVEPSLESPQPTVRRADQPMVTTLIRLTDEPFEVARTSILLAAESGPTMVVTANTALGDLGRLDVQVVVAATIEDAIEIAVEQVT